jgi:hypothetical protein
MDQGFWNGSLWIPADGSVWQAISASQILQSFQNLSVLVVGDSTMRFHYSAWLDFFNMSRPYPHHVLPDQDECAFSKVGWPTHSSCAQKWRGPCRDAMVNCIYSHTRQNVRLTFTWWRHGLPMMTLPKHPYDVVILSTGVWEARGKDWKKHTRKNIQLLHQSISGRHVFILSNGICAGAQRAFWHNIPTSSWPDSITEARVRDCNTVLEEYAKTKNVMYIDRLPSMYVPYNMTSPCFHHHPYGMMSDLHMQFILNAFIKKVKQETSNRRDRVS